MGTANSGKGNEGTGRATPRKWIDPEKIKLLAGSGCSQVQIAAMLDCSTDLLTRRFSHIINVCNEKAKAKLMIRMFQTAMSNRAGNIAMQIFLAKNWLGMRDIPPEVQRPLANFIVALPAEYKTAVNRALGFTGDLVPIDAGGTPTTIEGGTSEEASNVLPE